MYCKLISHIRKYTRCPLTICALGPRAKEMAEKNRLLTQIPKCHKNVAFMNLPFIKPGFYDKSGFLREEKLNILIDAIGATLPGTDSFGDQDF